jgi:hypothetical protein
MMSAMDGASARDGRAIKRTDRLGELSDEMLAEGEDVGARLRVLFDSVERVKEALDNGRDPATGGGPPQAAIRLVEGYCVKCRETVVITDPVQVTMKNGRPAVQGRHSECGTKIFKIGKLPTPGPTAHAPIASKTSTIISWTTHQGVEGLRQDALRPGKRFTSDVPTAGKTS